MTLMQIAEPGESSGKDKCKKRVIGIDLGTTHSLVAYVKDGKAVCLADDQGEVLLPSVVHYSKTGVALVGQRALEEAGLASKETGPTFSSIKRFMGKTRKDIPEEALRLYEVVSTEEDKVLRMKIHGQAGQSRTVTPVEISAEILRTLKERAEAALGGEIDGAVITVPAYFDEAQRQATKDAGRIAGLPVLRLLNEPTAAALAYGLDRRSQGRFAVYDLGGGTFDTSILELKEGIFTVLSTAGDTALGGDDMDMALAHMFLRKHPAGEKIAHEMKETPLLLRKLLALAKQVKHFLTIQEEVFSISLEGIPEHVSLSRREFEEAISELLERTSRCCLRALKDAELKPTDLDGVILVGGATRVPAVRKHVEKLFLKEPLSDVDPDQVVALGAAIQADVIANQRQDVLLIDVTPLSLGLVLMGDIVEKIIPRNSRIPTAARQKFTTYADGQTGFDLHVVQGERETSSGCRSLARFQLQGIPRMAAGMAQLEVTFLVDENGLLHVSAKELLSGKEAHVEVVPSYGLEEQEIERMLLDSYEHAEEDVRLRQLAEIRVEAGRVLEALKKALATDVALVTDEEKNALGQTMVKLEEAIRGTDGETIRTCLEKLERESQPFMERRVNQLMSETVAGKSINTVLSEMQKESR